MAPNSNCQTIQAHHRQQGGISMSLSYDQHYVDFLKGKIAIIQRITKKLEAV
jgi:hypothetical protein